MQFTYTSYDIYRWHPWFAWHPVMIVSEAPNSLEKQITWVWLSKVERKMQYGWKYRLPTPLDNNT